MTPSRLLCAAAVAACLTLTSAAPGIAAPSAKTYANCTAIHKVYSGGIAKAGVRFNTVGAKHRALKGKVKFSTALYDANRKSDRDKDGIACEKS